MHYFILHNVPVTFTVTLLFLLLLLLCVMLFCFLCLFMEKTNNDDSKKAKILKL